MRIPYSVSVPLLKRRNALVSLAWRNLAGSRTRTVLSVLAVALGVTVIIVGDMIGGSILNAISDSEIAQLTGVELFEQLASLLTLVGIAVTAAAGFLVFNAFAMSVTQRRQQIGALRALGMTRRQVMRLVLVEALITGGLGTLFGLVVGPLMGRGVIALLSTTDMFLDALTEGSVSLSSFFLAAALGVGITLFSVLLPARRATRVSPLDALRAPESTRIVQNPVRPALVGLVIAVGLAIYLLVAPPGEWVSPPWDSRLTGLFTVAWLVGLALMLPAWVGGVGDRARRPLSRWLGAVGRLIADNLQRGRGRVTLTIATLAVGLAMIVGTTGFITFFLHELFGHTLRSAIQQRGWVVSSFQVTQNVADFVELDSLQLLPEAIEKVESVVNGRGEILGFYFAVVPDLSFMGSNYFSFVLDPKVLRETGDTFFTFTEGDWETAMPIMESGCGLLLTPLVAQKNNAWIGDTLTVQGVGGDVECTIVGIGQSYVSASIISGAAANVFGATDLLSLYVSPSPNVAPSLLEADLNALADRHPGIYVMQLDDMARIQQSAFDQVRSMLNGMLLLAIVAAALGVVNTTMMSVAERRRELGLLRAVGATRRQVTRVVTGEAALMGLIGGGLGLVAGVGVTLVLVVTYGGNAWGIPGLDLWGAAWRSAQPALFNGLVGLFAAPLICAGAAWLPARSILRGSAVETLNPERRHEVARTAKRETPMRSLYFISWRNMQQGQTRTVLSVLAVALGVAVIIATGVTSAGVKSGIEETVKESVAFVTDMVGVGLSIAGVMILVAAGFLIFNAFGMAVTQRRRQIGALCSLGGTRRQMMQLVLVEALIVGGLGTGLGVVGGPILGRGILAAMRVAGYELGAGSVSASGIALAVAVGLAVTLLSVLIPAHRATRIAPLVAMRPDMAAGLDRMSRARVWVGLAIIAVLWSYLAAAPPGKWTLEPWNYAMPFLLAVPWLGALLLLAPAVVGGVGQVLRVPLARLWKASGSLMADNLRRGRRRVTITALTFAVSVMTVVGVTGVFNFFGKVLIDHAQETRFQSGLEPGWSIGAADFTQGVMNAGGMIAGLKPEVIAEVYRVAEGRATVGVERPVVVPEIAAVLVPNYFSSMLDLNLLAVPGNVRFLEGDLETALPIMEAGCGVLLAPGAAARNGVEIGHTLTIQSKRGPLECTVAGVVVMGVVPISVISPAVKDHFDAGDPTSVIIFPRAGIDRAALEADLQAIDEKYGDDAWLLRWQENVDTVAESTDWVLALMSSLLVLAVVAAALGQINTTVMSVAERRQELGLFRAVGATRRQVTAVVVGEAALIGFIGSTLGLIAGAGLGAIFTLAHGGNNWGYPDIDLWDAAWRSVRPALGNGLVGLIAAPLLSAAAAWFPVRRLLRGSAVETLNPGRRPEAARSTVKRKASCVR